MLSLLLFQIHTAHKLVHLPCLFCVFLSRWRFNNARSWPICYLPSYRIDMSTSRVISVTLVRWSRKTEEHRRCDQISWRERQDGKWTQGSSCSCWRLELLRNSCAALSVLKTPARWQQRAFLNRRRESIIIFLMLDLWLMKMNEIFQPTISIVE